MMKQQPTCPECGLYLSENHEHRCGVPILTEAAGVPLTPLEERYVRWLAGWDFETVDVIAGLLKRCRGAGASLEAEPEATEPPEKGRIYACRKMLLDALELHEGWCPSPCTWKANTLAWFAHSLGMSEDAGGCDAHQKHEGEKG